MSQEPDATVDTSGGTIAEDVHCGHCGYNLRGLSSDGRCPECGTPVGRSTQGNLLRYADPQWLKKLLLGVRLALWMVALLVAGIATMFCGVSVFAAGGGTPPFAVFVIGLVYTVLLWILSFASLYLITSQEPRISLTEDPVTLRKVLRTCAVLSLVGNVFEQGAQTFHVPAIVGFSGGVLSLAGVVSLFGWFVFMRRFARRIPDPKLVRSTSAVMWGVCVIVGLFFVGGLTLGLSVGGGGAMTAAPPTTMPATSPATAVAVTPPPGLFGSVGTAFGGLLMCAGFIAAIVFGIAYVVLLFRYRRAFSEALEQAQALASEDGGAA